MTNEVFFAFSIPIGFAKEALVGAWRSLVAHLFWVQGVGGSNPLAPTILQKPNILFGPFALAGGPQDFIPSPVFACSIADLFGSGRWDAAELTVPAESMPSGAAGKINH